MRRTRLEETVRHLLAQDDVAVEVIVVDDRSTDRTGDILRRLASEDARVRAKQVESLPDGWLGKCHACHVGASAATGEWILFTDADCWLKPDVIARALRVADREQADHITLTPGVAAETLGARAWHLAFLSRLASWISGVNRDRSNAYLGLGAFNLVRASAYRECGGYEALRLTILDDVKLGLLLHRAGKRTRAFIGGDDVECHWGTTVPGMIKIMEKNYFAAADFRTGPVLAGGLIATLLVERRRDRAMDRDGRRHGRRTRAVVVGAASGRLRAASGLVPPLSGPDTAALPRARLRARQLGLRDPPPWRRPMARHVLSAGHTAQRESSVTAHLFSLSGGMHSALRLQHQEEWRMGRTRTGNRLSLLGKVSRGSMLTTSKCVAAIVLGIIVFALASGKTTMAQSSNAPAVRVLRDFRLDQKVWPADLNRDGVTDLISSSATTFSGGTASGGNLQVSTGKGDGTFNTPVQSSFRGFVLGAADFNGDQKVDVIASSVLTVDGSSFVLLPGTGTTTLGAPVVLAPVPDTAFAFALSADFNGDGKRDLVVPDNGGVVIYPGNGDFTFGTPATLPDANVPIEGIVADFNGDGRRDLAIVNMFSSLSIFLNQGSLLFSAADISMPPGGGERPVTDATVADVNGDGRIDLLVSAGRAEEIFFGPGAGFVLVMPGNGDGTFGTPVEYPVARGPLQIVAGDFNRDGVTDIVTGNQSSFARDDCAAPSRKTWDSVSILTGRGNGTFTGPWNFSIGDQGRSDPNDPDDDRYRNTLTSLNTSDLNGDRSTDLIASHGAVLLNIAATPNRAPVADAGPDTVLFNTHETVLRPMASDADNDMLTWELRDETGAGISNYPNYCYQQLHIGDNTITVTVDDGHGHRVSDTVVYTVVSTDSTQRRRHRADHRRSGGRDAVHHSLDRRRRREPARTFRRVLLERQCSALDGDRRVHRAGRVGAAMRVAASGAAKQQKPDQGDRHRRGRPELRRRLSSIHRARRVRQYPAERMVARRHRQRRRRRHRQFRWLGLDGEGQRRGHLGHGG